MGVAGGAALAAAAAPAWLPRVSYAKDFRSGQRDIVISIYLRGAADGLSICTPFTDANYYAARPGLSLAQPDSGLDNRLLAFAAGGTVNNAPSVGGTTSFGLNPALAPLMPAYDDGNLLFIQGCGSTDPSRSHFDAQRFMEVGKPADPTISTGWLGRHLLSVAPREPDSLLRAVGISTALPRTLVGGPLTLPIPNLDTFGLSGNGATTAARSVAIGDMYGPVEDPIHAAAINTLATIDLLNTINFSGYVPAGGAVYPTTGIGTALKSSAALMKAVPDKGIEAIAIDVQGWDTHNNQGLAPGGTMYTLLSQLATAIAAFHTDMFTGVAPTFTLIVMSEFGRRLTQNGSLGTDHGHGNAMMVMGNCVHGGRVLTNAWPTLAVGKLYQGIDLDVTIDFRDILAEIAQVRLGNNNLAYLFPDFTPTFRGVTNC